MKKGQKQDWTLGILTSPIPVFPQTLIWESPQETIRQMEMTKINYGRSSLRLDSRYPWSKSPSLTPVKGKKTINAHRKLYGYLGQAIQNSKCKNLAKNHCVPVKLPADCIPSFITHLRRLQLNHKFLNENVFAMDDMAS